MPRRSNRRRRGQRVARTNYSASTTFRKGVRESDVDNLLRRTAGTRTGSAASMAANAIQLARGVAGLLNTEFKRIDNSASIGPTNALSYTILNAVGQGATSTTRNGNSIRMAQLDFRFSAANSSVAGTLTLLRMMIISFKNPNGAIPATSFPLQAVDVLSPWDPDRSQLATLLHDELLVLTPGGDNQLVTGNISTRLSMHTEYNGAGATNTAIVTNAIYLVLLSNQAVNTPTLNYYSRVQFIDN